jgi:hypothetical protein
MLTPMTAARGASIGRLEPFRRPGHSPVTRSRLRSTRAAMLVMTCAVLLMGGRQASASSRIVADFDGDGIGDHGAVSQHDPTVVRVWLSSTHRMALIHSREPVLSLAAADVDGDSRADLVARMKSAVRVWVRKNGRFHAYRVRNHSFASRFTRTRNRAGNADPLCAELNATDYSHVAPSVQSTVLMMTPVRAVWTDLSHPVRGPTSGSPVSPFTPRPPPRCSSAL